MKRQTSSHRFSIPARRSMLLLRRNIMFLFMIHQELDQSPECHWMSVTLRSWRTSEGSKVDSIGCLYELLEFLIWGGTSEDSGNLPNQGPREPDQPPALGELLRSTEINVLLNPRRSTAPLAKIWCNSQESVVKLISIWAMISELWRIAANEFSWWSVVLSLN